MKFCTPGKLIHFWFTGSCHYGKETNLKTSVEDWKYGRLEVFYWSAYLLYD